MKKILYIAVVSLLILSGCDGFKGAATPLPTVSLDSGQTAPAQRTEEPYLKAAEKNVPSTGGVTASGVVTSQNQAQFIASTSGSVQEVRTTVGADVKSGDILVVLSGREKMKAAVEAARYELVSAQQALDAVNRDADKVRAAALVRLAEAKKRWMMLSDAVITVTTAMALRALLMPQKPTTFWLKTTLRKPKTCTVIMLTWMTIMSIKRAR
jgi:multidrug efflux pump subunit AcrA (membrane-fusion protein)